MSFKITVNVAAIRDKALRFSYPKANRVGVERAREIINERKDRFLEAFDEHEVSLEIAAGEEPNYSVDGVSGNLFSFIGFDNGSNPVEDLYEYLDSVIKLANRRGKFDLGSRTITYTMSGPTEEGIKKKTDLSQYTINNNETNWGEGMSWVEMVERGIPGLNKYKFSNDPKVLGAESRSGTGLQRRNVIRPTSSVSRPREYLTELLKILAGVNK